LRSETGRQMQGKPVEQRLLASLMGRHRFD
jgi:hypothetical protein